ncbi:sigma-70 family RNA polymerase sigma factor [Fodinicurvata halophila]|uniref:RNA polymerase sigma factor n=1 Tax=Fodinicurvata halophila TaxID=1419723 RepID=A0ABV8UH06_9PROT
MEQSVDLLERPVENAFTTGSEAVAAAAGIAFHGRMSLTDDSSALRPAGHAILLQAVAEQGDREAFAELFAYFAPRLKAYLVRLGSDSGAAEELVQEVMILVWRKAASFDANQASVSTWIFTIARNKRIDALRRDRRGELDSEDPLLQPEAEPSADKAVEARQDSERVRAALEQLPPEQAELIRKAYFEDKAHGAIALESELPLGTVKSRLRLALGRLRRTLKEDEQE